MLIRLSCPGERTNASTQDFLDGVEQLFGIERLTIQPVALAVCPAASCQHWFSVVSMSNGVNL